jgi:soluble lytic murein transglycosylase-like protein
MARRYRPAPGTREWTTPDAIRYRLGADIFPFKDQWVRGYRSAIFAAARRFDLPPELLAGVAYNEAGGDPSWIDGAAYALRQGDRADRTSFGNMSIQVRTAFEALGYESAGPWQRRAMIASLSDPATSIFIAARVLANLRDREFRGIRARQLTREQIEVIGARYNRGPAAPRSRLDLDYGRDITKRWRHLRRLITGR